MTKQQKIVSEKNIMKNIITYKKIDDVRHSDLPLNNVVFRNDGAEPWRDSLSPCCGIGVAGYPDSGYVKTYQDSYGNYWNQCAQVIERCPRSVPQELLPFPENKPFLAYIGTSKSIENCYVFVEYRWQPVDNKIKQMYREALVHVAIDVSTEWAAENYPEIVDAMEYEPIFSYIDPKSMSPQKTGHKLGNRTYDLNWQPTDLLPEDEKNDNTRKTD